MTEADLSANKYRKTLAPAWSSLPQEEMERRRRKLDRPGLIDPRRILAAIAINKSMPPTARVAACKALLGVKDQDATAGRMFPLVISMREQSP